MAGVKLGIGIDISEFKRDISLINKQLTTVAGQKYFVNLDFASAVKNATGATKKIRQELVAVQGELKEALKNVSGISYTKKNGGVVNVQDIKTAISAMSQLNRELKQAQKAGDNIKIKSITNNIAAINEYREALQKASDVAARAGLASTPTKTAQMKFDRSGIDAQIKALEKRRTLLNANTNLSETTRLQNEIQLQQQLVNLLQKKAATYKGTNKKNTTALYNAQAELEALRSQKARIKAVENANKGLARAIENINRLEQQRGNLDKYDKKLTQLRAESAIVNKLITQWKTYLKHATASGNQQGIADANTQLSLLAKRKVQLTNLAEEERARIRATNQNNSLLNDQGRLLGKLKTLASNYLSVFTVFNFGKKIIETTGYFEKQEVALQGILRSASAARKAINELKGMALESPFELKDLVAYTKQLSAYGIEEDKLLSTTSKLADLSTGLGVDMNRLILAYGQVKSASVLRGQELRQFTEAGIPMVQALADKFTQLNGKLTTTGDVFELISKRQVPFEMVAEVLSDMTAEGGKFYKMQENVTDTVYGQVQKLKDLWTISLNDIGSGLSKPIRGFIGLLQSAVKNFRAIIITIAGIGFTNLFKAIWADVKLIGAGIANWVRGIRAAQGAAAKFKAVISGIGKALISNVAIAALSAIAGVITNAVMKAREFGNSLKKIDASFAKDTAKYVQGFDALLGKLSSLTEGTKEYNQALNALQSNYGEYVNPAIIDQLIAERRQLDNTSEGWGILHDSIVAAIQAKKDYERHEARKSEAGNKATEDFMGGTSDWVMKLLKDKAEARKFGEDGRGYKVDKEYQDIYNHFNSEESKKNIQSALDFAISSFFSGDMTTKEELQSEIQRSFQNSGVANNVTKFVVENIDKIWRNLSNTEAFDTYLKEHDINENSPRKIIDRRFEEAKRTTAGRQEGRWVEGMSNADYNPAKLAQAEDYDLAVAARDLVSNIAKSVQDKRDSGSADSDLFAGENGLTNYKNALAAFNQQVTDMSVGSFEAAEKTKAISDAIYNLATTINDSELHSLLTKIQGDFTQLAGVKTGRAASISTAIEQDMLGSGVLDKESKDFYKRYVPTDLTIEELRNAIKSSYDSLEAEIKSYGSTQGNPANAEHVKGLKKQQDMLRVLAGEKYYDIDLTKAKGGGSYNHNKEYDEFLNEFKSAYDMYKNAVQKGGVEIGTNYVRNNEKVQEMFGGFFNGGEFGDKFKQTKAGDNTIMELLKDKFITSGVEKGIVDFKAAAEAVADDLKKAADKNKGTAKGQDLLQSYNSMVRWIESTFSKDNLNAVLADLEKQIKDLSRTFESTTKNVELYRKLMQNGTLGTVGSGLGVTREQALSTTSSRQKANLGGVVAKYNEQVSTISNGKGTAYNLGNLNTLSDVDTALQQIAALRKMNDENFSTTELGQTTSTIEGLLNQLRETMTQEMESVSGEKFSGKSLEDTIANAINKSKAADFELAQAEAVAKQYGTTDQAAIKRNVESAQNSATSIYDTFLKDNRFDSLANSNFGKVSLDWSTLEQKFDKMVQDLPDNLRAELERKKIDFKMSVDSYNASIGSLGSFGSAFSTYRNADTIAKGEYDDEVARRDSLQSQLKSGKKADGTALSTEEMAQLQAQIDACNQSLDEMGENGVNLATKLKQVSLANMAASIDKSQKALGDMSGAVLAVVNAAKGLASTINKVYDVMNDGENPAWMQDMESFLEDFGTSFSEMITPISAVIGMVSSLTVAITTCAAAATPLIAITAVLVAAAATVALIVAAVQQHDRELERANENLEKRIEDTQNAITNLNAAAERMTGFEKWGTSLEAAGKSLENYRDSLQQMNNEIEKKNTDEDKVKEYKQNAQEALDEFYSGLKDLQDELTGGVESWADSMSEALRSAFQNGENAARAMHSSVKTMIGDMIEEIMKMAILEPLLQNAMDELLGGSYEQIKDKYTDKNGKFDSEGYTAYVKSALTDSKKLDKFEKSAVNAGNVWLETYAAMEEKLKEYLAHNSDTSSLSSGIESITEDTARTLEGLANSQLSVTIQIRQLLEQSLLSGSSSSGDNTSATMASIQTHVSSINSNVAQMLKGFNELRDTQSRPLHVTVV